MLIEIGYTLILNNKDVEYIRGIHSLLNITKSQLQNIRGMHLWYLCD